MKILRLLILFVVLSLAAKAQKKEITLEDIWSNGTFSAEGVYGLTSMNDGLHYSSLESDDKDTYIVKYEYKTGKSKDTLLKASSFNGRPGGLAEKFRLEDYSFSPDETKIMLSTATEMIYRHSTKCTNFIYDRKSKTRKALSQNGKQMYATFSPKSDKVAFVRANNIFIVDLNTYIETQITSDGELNKIINGANDWVYEEEFSFSVAFFWNEDGSKLAYYRFDESAVKEFDLTMYGSLYPSQTKYKYPKAGETNATVELYVYDVASNKATKVDVGENKDQYIPRVKWTKDKNTLSFIRLNRLQNKLELMLADATSGTSKAILTETSDTYIDIFDDLTFLSDGKTFVWSSESDGFKHLYLYDLTGKKINQLTKGNWDVIEIKGIDEKKRLVYYLAAEISPMQKELYCINLDGSGKKKLSLRTGTNSAEFSNNFQYYINVNSNANTPSYTSLHTSDGKEIRVLEDNKKLNELLGEYVLSKKEFFTFKTSENVELNAWMIKPANFDKNKKYPVFMTVYGGPGHNTVLDTWESSNYLWHQLMAQKGFIVVSVDNRGTGFRGEKFKKCTYKQLGKLETMDQIEAAKYFCTLPYVDKDRIGIEGWSYGGYMSSLCMTKGADYFKVGIAVAPVTNWRYYDSIYTERFLQTPQENASGYDDNSPINHVKLLKGKYLLVHGTADDNVHYQNSLEMTTALVKANKQFDMFMYPNKNHGIYGGNTRLHLYTKMTDYLIKNL